MWRKCRFVLFWSVCFEWKRRHELIFFMYIQVFVWCSDSFSSYAMQILPGFRSGISFCSLYVWGGAILSLVLFRNQNEISSLHFFPPRFTSWWKIHVPNDCRRMNQWKAPAGCLTSVRASAGGFSRKGTKQMWPNSGDVTIERHYRNASRATERRQTRNCPLLHKGGTSRPKYPCFIQGFLYYDFNFDFNGSFSFSVCFIQ